MKTYPIIIRFNDGSEKSETLQSRDEQREAEEQAKLLPEAREIETRVFRGETLQGGWLSVRETAAHLAGTWYTKSL